MTTRQILALPKPHPLGLFATVLFCIFAVEAGVMLALPRLIPPDSNVTFTAVLDACLLTIGLAPLIWWLIVRPLYRISQEAIANTIRHGAASRIDVVLRCDSSRVELSIRDNGVGFCPSNLASRHSEKSPFGLLSIHERARLLGGNAWIESEVGAGAHVRVQLPVAGMETIDGEDSGSIG